MFYYLTIIKMLVVLGLGILVALGYKRKEKSQGRKIAYIISLILSIIIGLAGIVSFPAIILQGIFFGIGYAIGCAIK